MHTNIPSKPVHPAFVHFPIAFLGLAYAMDILHQLGPNLPSIITSNLPLSTDLTRASYNLLTLGLLFAIPAVLSGVREAIMAIGKQGLFEADGKTVKSKFKAMIAHAVFNDVLVVVSAYVWYSRRALATQTLAGKLGVGSAAVTPEAAYAPQTWMVGAEAVCFVMLMMAANIGGVLTYNFGLGLAVGGAGSKKTQ